MFAEASRANIEKESENDLDVHPGGARVTTVRPSVRAAAHAPRHPGFRRHTRSHACGRSPVAAGGWHHTVPVQVPWPRPRRVLKSLRPRHSAHIMCPAMDFLFTLLRIHGVSGFCGFEFFFIRQSFFKNCLSSLLSILSFWDSDLV